MDRFRGLKSALSTCPLLVIVFVSAQVLTVKSLFHLRNLLLLLLIILVCDKVRDRPRPNVSDTARTSGVGTNRSTTRRIRRPISSRATQNGAVYLTLTSTRIIRWMNPQIC